MTETRGTPVLFLAVAALLAPLPSTAADVARASSPAPEPAWSRFGLVERAGVLGDLAEPGCPSSTLIRLHAGTRLPPHAAAEERAYLVLSGTVRVGSGKEFDPSHLHTLPAGSVWVVPPGVSTFTSNDEEVVCLVTVSRPDPGCPIPREALFVTPDRIAWKHAGPVDRAVLAGDPRSEGCPSVVRYRMPDSPPRSFTVHARAEAAVGTVFAGGPAAGDVGSAAGLPFLLPPHRRDLPGEPAGAVLEVDDPGAGPPACRIVPTAPAPRADAAQSP